MGLVICKRIIENSGGQIQVVSAGEDKGATFMFSISMKLPEKVENSRTPVLHNELLQPAPSHRSMDIAELLD